MTAAQRNCYLVIQDCLERYSLDDVRFAISELTKESGDGDRAATVTSPAKSVWVIEQGDYSDYRVVGVYSSEENARRVCELIGGKYDKPEVDEWPLDPSIEELNAGLSQFICLMKKDGTVKECQREMLSPTCSVSFNIHYHPDKEGVLQGFSVWATDAEHAIKITNEKRTQLIASGEWK